MAVKIRFQFCLMLIALLVIGGCELQPYPSARLLDSDSASIDETVERYTYEKYTKSSTSEELLAAEGRWHLVEVEHDELSPLQQHMRARNQVDPSNYKKTAQYTTKEGAPHEETHFRVLRLAGGRPAKKTKAFKALRVPEPKFETELAAREPQPGMLTPQKKPKLKSGLEKTQKMAQVLADHKATVVSLRIGEHPGKTRVVLDLNGASGFTHDLNNDKHMLLIELPEADWSAGKEKIFKDHPLIQAYMVKPSPKGGTMLAIRLKQNSKLVFSTAYKPTQGYDHHRIILDVAAG